jgi:hypothetical protein
MTRKSAPGNPHLLSYLPDNLYTVGKVKVADKANAIHPPKKQNLQDNSPYAPKVISHEESIAKRPLRSMQVQFHIPYTKARVQPTTQCSVFQPFHRPTNNIRSLLNLLLRQLPILSFNRVSYEWEDGGVVA